MRKILWRAAVIIPLLSVLVAVPLKTDLFKSRVDATTLNPLVTAEFEQNKKAIDEDIRVESAKTEEAVKLTSEVPVIPEVTPAVSTEINTYYLITGSFKSEENAVSQANMLKEEGFTSEVVPASNGFYRVSAMICRDMKTAITKKDSISKKFPGTWVSKKR